VSVPSRGTAGATFADAVGAVATECNGATAGRYSGGTTQQLVFGGAAAAYQCMHDGTGGTLWIVYAAETSTAEAWIASTQRLANNRIGFDLSVTATKAIHLTIGNGSGVMMVDATSAAGVLKDNVPHAIVVRTKTAGVTNQVQVFVDGVSVIAAAYVGAPSGDPATFGLSWGTLAFGGAGFTAQGLLPEIGIAAHYATDAEVSKLTHYMLTAWRRPFRRIRLMPAGDSITVGGNTGGYRTGLWGSALARHGLCLDYVGSQSLGYAQFGDYTLGDWSHEGHSGRTIEYIGGKVVDYITANGAPDAIFLQAGTNDVPVVGQTANAMLALMGTQLDAIIAAGMRPERIFPSTITPWNAAADDVPTRAAREVIRVGFNAGLAALCASKGCTYVNCGGSLVNGDLDADGVHPSNAGYVKLTAAWLAVLTQYFGSYNGKVIPRAFAATAENRILRLTQDADGVSIPAHATVIPAGSGSLTLAAWVYVDSLDDPAPAAFRPIMQAGDPYADGILIAQSGTLGTAIVCVHDANSTFSLPLRLVAGAWHRVMLVLDASTSKARIYVNGQFGGEATAAWNFATALGVLVGAAQSRPAFRGRACELHFAAGYAASDLDVMADYYDATPASPTLPATAIYPMHEGAGTSIAASVGGGGAGTISGAGAGWTVLAMRS
jgi:lysophospholipase L1-like esterase